MLVWGDTYVCVYMRMHVARTHVFLKCELFINWVWGFLFFSEIAKLLSPALFSVRPPPPFFFFDSEKGLFLFQAVLEAAPGYVQYCVAVQCMRVSSSSVCLSFSSPHSCLIWSNFLEAR